MNQQYYDPQGALETATNAIMMKHNLNGVDSVVAIVLDFSLYDIEIIVFTNTSYTIPGLGDLI